MICEFHFIWKAVGLNYENNLNNILAMYYGIAYKPYFELFLLEGIHQCKLYVSLHQSNFLLLHFTLLKNQNWLSFSSHTHILMKKCLPTFAIIVQKLLYHLLWSASYISNDDNLRIQIMPTQTILKIANFCQLFYSCKSYLICPFSFCLYSLVSYILIIV